MRGKVKLKGEALKKAGVRTVPGKGRVKTERAKRIQSGNLIQFQHLNA